MQLKNSKCDKTKKLVMRQNSRTENCDKTQIVTKLNFFYYGNSKIQTVTKYKKIGLKKNQKFKM